MIKSGTKLIQLYAAINGLIFIYFGIKLRDPIMVLGGSIIVFRDTILFFRDESCTKTDNIKFDMSIRSGNKLIQFIATLFGIYLMVKFNIFTLPYSIHNLILFMLGVIIFLGDGYLAIFEDPKYCIITR